MLPPESDFYVAVTLPVAVQNQRGLNSCGAIAFCDMVAISLHAAGRFDVLPQLSPMFLYYNTRRLRGKVGLNCPLEFEHLLQASQAYGLCRESTWPYELSRFHRTPPPEAYAEARTFPEFTASVIAPSPSAIRDSLANGYPVFAGIRLFTGNARSFWKGEIARTGDLHVCTASGAHVANHAVLLVGVDPATGRYIARNSLGKEWGRSGYLEISESYLLDPEKSFLLATICR